MMNRNAALALLAALCLWTANTVSAADAPIEIKVVVVSMFEIGKDTGDQPAEFQLWY